MYPHIARRDAAAGVNANWLRSLRPAEAARASPCALLEWGEDRPSAPAPAQEAPGAPLAEPAQQPGPAALGMPVSTASCGDQARSQRLTLSAPLPGCLLCPVHAWPRLSKVLTWRLWARAFSQSELLRQPRVVYVRQDLFNFQLVSAECAGTHLYILALCRALRRLQQGTRQPQPAQLWASHAGPLPRPQRTMLPRDPFTPVLSRAQALALIRL